MNIHDTPIAGVRVVQTRTLGDARGSFVRVFCAEQLAAAGAPLAFVQINLSRTRAAGTVRGLHFQRPPAAEAKLIRCLRGRVFDVAVDLRRGSPTFGHWFGVELAADNDTEILIPQGCAHGFQALTDDVELLYHHTAPYTPALEGGVRFDDPALAIDWPLPARNVSARDQQLPPLSAMPGIDL